jgi:membrane protein DedA with SNARE-associated domain
MMNQIIEFLISHREVVVPVMAVLILAASAGFPMSIDIMLIFIACIAIEMPFKDTLILFLTFTVSCIASASLGYWIARSGWNKLKDFSLFKRLLPKEHLEKMEKYYNRFGIWTIFFVRFIPFGARNVVYYTAGISKLSYVKFLLSDIVAAFLWAGIFFSIFYNLAETFETLVAKQKWINVSIFCCFSVTVIGLICYKVINRKSS